ncbi:Peptide chain release factor 1 [Rubripirellula lacrimiformis]|uniref:Peptide chain release factor 1 n=2 Tax=Rubripirellula lacrimiformis TaxID=1930273 RepID=A0A517N831_9BACT|nr:Peptide chain release factor 1 [Rubripirellula lacrimiformis]
MPVSMVDGVHPVWLDDDALLTQCDLRFQRRSGPGGQHRNKTSSGVFLHHEPTGVTAEATERRSQADNRSVALSRLRFRLAVQRRSPSVLEIPASPPAAEFRQRYRGHPLKFRDTHPDRPVVLSLLLDDLHASGGQPSAVAKIWKVSTTSIVNLMKSHPAAFTLVNEIRSHHGRRPLK